VAALALHGAMSAGKRVLRPGVVKSLSFNARKVPSTCRMALRAVGAESALMSILVATAAIGRQS
jgi:hypothetical protein